VLRAVVLTQYWRVTDGRIDGQTDRETDGIAIASTALVMRALRRAVKTVHLCYQTVVCPDLSVCDLRQTVCWTKMPLDIEVGLGSGEATLC